MRISKLVGLAMVVGNEYSGGKGGADGRAEGDGLPSERRERPISVGGAAFAVKRSLDMFVAVARTLEGRNGHLHDSVVTVGVSRTFGTRFASERASLGPAGKSVPTPKQALVCTCAKSR
jgi:hypothetical protein